MAKPPASPALVRLDQQPWPDMPVEETDAPRQHWRRWLVWLVFVVPVLVSFLYNFVVATPRYASEVAFVVRSSQTPRDRLSIVSLGQGGGISASDDSETVVAYLQSRDMLDSINHDGLVTRTFARRGLDPIAAFPSLLAGDSREDFYRHFQAYVDSRFDRATNIVHVQVQSFTAADARAIARRLLAASEAMVNRLNRRAQTSMVGSAERDVAQASAQLASVLARMNAVRNRNRIIEPELDAGAAVKLQSGTAAELAQIEVQLGQILRSAPQSPLIRQLRARRSALESQLGHQIGATAGSNGSLASRLRGYEELAVRRDIAEKQLMAASLQLISAHGSASRQQLYLEEIARPNLPDKPRYPRRWLNLLVTVLVAGCLLWIASSLAELVFDDE
jgi:BexC/CtrB/KpsE family polysaccharide export inner-membrane protein